MASIFLDPGFYATYAVVQAIVLLLVFRAVDPFEPVPIWLVFLLAVWGGTAAAVIALAGDEAIKTLLSGDSREVFGDAIVPPVVEEFAKGFALLIALLGLGTLAKSISDWRFEGAMTGLVCGAAIGVGFAFTEDFFYFVNHAGDAGVKAGADIYLGRRDFFGPTALHHPLFTAAIGAGLGAAVLSTSRRAKVLWPLLGFAVAVAMHAVNNGLVELILVIDHGLENAMAWVNGQSVPASVQSTADTANGLLFVLDYAYVLIFLAWGILWQRNARRAVSGSLQVDVESGLIGSGDLDRVCRFGGRTGVYFSLARTRQEAELQRLRLYDRAIAKLGMARWRMAQGHGEPAVIPELRRRVIAAAGVVQQPGAVQAPGPGLVGRQQELATLSTLLLDRRTRQLTVIGPGGAGKTRLCLEVADRLGRDFAHGAYLVDLSVVTDHREVAERIAASLEVELPAGENQAAWLGRLLRDWEMLLVLDNFEHVVAAAPLVTDLVRATSRVQVVVTTRVALGALGETEFHLEPLPTAPGRDGPSEAGQLFLDRASRVGAQLVATDMPAIEDICQRLDGLPLAIELVAARMRSISPAAISTRLSSALDLAGTGGAGLPDRQRTLRGAVAWSENLLDGPSRELFLAIARFPAGCRLDGLAGVRDGNRLLPILEKLVASSLLRATPDPDDQPRYQMLATIREYALERPAERGGSIISTPAYCATIVSQLPSTIWPREVVERLDLERPNFIAAIDDLTEQNAPAEALRLMTSLGPLWERGSIPDARARLTSLLVDGDLTQDQLAQGHWLDGRLALLSGEYAQASTVLSVALEETVEAGLRFSCQRDLGWVSMFRGSIQKAEALFGAAAEEAGSNLGDRECAQALAALGRARAELGDPAAGTELARRSLELHLLTGDARGAISSRSTLARATLLTGDTDTAVSEASLAVAQARELGDRLREAEALFPLASGQLIAARLGESLAATKQRLGACQDLGDRLGIAEVLDLCGLLAEVCGDRQQAERVITASSSLRTVIEAPRWPWDSSVIADRIGPSAEFPPAHMPALSVTEAAGLADRVLAGLSQAHMRRSG